IPGVSGRPFASINVTSDDALSFWPIAAIFPSRMSTSVFSIIPLETVYTLALLMRISCADAAVTAIATTTIVAAKQEIFMAPPQWPIAPGESLMEVFAADANDQIPRHRQ